ncbi:hypothetical protein [Enterococcus wangshanyuanii]|uniref:Transglycosylase n=1 Tax=Enterococcus wangshanyuanii TaxID=2005703 RepID=A0ABQ1NI69_9ENTE|nr:hypothetical protein [Enterococcus wangshanyuanii]GGC74907.1 hypothetical protein GCM10011573_00560 [Enterococcus wangshanyuanii]
MAKEKYVCNKCGKHTPFVQEVENLPDGVERHYAGCQSCGYQSTIFYIDSEIKSLMYQQKNTAFGTKKKERLTKQIQGLMDDLKQKIESKGENDENK